MSTASPPGWWPDPTARHQYRYFDGTAWTEHVSNSGVLATDSLVAAPPSASSSEREQGAPEPAPAGASDDVANAELYTTTTAAVLKGGEHLDVVGESHCQDDLWAIVGGRSTDPIRHPIRAVLTPEHDNPYDENAIAVEIDGRRVGYLPRELAETYRPGLLALMAQEQQYIALEGAIVGGGRRPDGIGSLGVFLRHDPADFGIVKDTDTSWRERLPDDDARAIKFLRGLLEQEESPVERHYMFQELEQRLYRCRDVFTSALDDYDTACSSHDAEMESIGAALAEEFKGTLPRLETYHQMAIRQAKARHWQLGLTWAERGLELYGDRAENQDWPADLRRRAESFAAKIKTSPSTSDASERSTNSGTATSSP
jgi:hypothetical protein